MLENCFGPCLTPIFPRDQLFSPFSMIADYEPIANAVWILLLMIGHAWMRVVMGRNIFDYSEMLVCI